MGKLRIVDVRPKPWWKFWTADNLEVTLDDEGKQRTITVYHRSSSSSFSMAMLREQILEKYLTGDQFWSLHQIEKRASAEARTLIGETLEVKEVKDKIFQIIIKARDKQLDRKEAEDDV